jgi:hypothetical protein
VESSKLLQQGIGSVTHVHPQSYRQDDQCKINETVIVIKVNIMVKNQQNKSQYIAACSSIAYNVMYSVISLRNSFYW